MGIWGSLWYNVTCNAALVAGRQSPLDSGRVNTSFEQHEKHLAPYVRGAPPEVIAELRWLITAGVGMAAAAAAPGSQ